MTGYVERIYPYSIDTFGTELSAGSLAFVEMSTRAIDGVRYESGRIDYMGAANIQSLIDKVIRIREQDIPANADERYKTALRGERIMAGKVMRSQLWADMKAAAVVEVCGREDCNYPIADCGHGDAGFYRERSRMMAAGHTGTRCAHCGGFREEYTNYVRELRRVVDVYNPHCVQCWVDGHGNARDQRLLGVVCEDFDCAISAAHDCIRRGIAEDWHEVARRGN